MKILTFLKPALVVFDNFFTSFKLLKILKTNGLYACGTVRVNRKGLPEMMKRNDKLKRGEYKFATKCGIASTKWMDNKPVTMLSTIHHPKKLAFVKRKKKYGSSILIPCPEVVDQYNKHMGGVDRFDQLRERYQVGRRSVKWWHRIVYFIIDLAIVNGFILWRLSKRNPSSDQLSFRLRLARQLIGNYCSRKRRGRQVMFLAKKRQVPDDVRLAEVGKHFPIKSTYKRCRLCSVQKNQKRTRYVCSSCSVPLCMPECFNKFHEK